MRIKKVNRYWCEFCNKAGLSAGHMRTHEKHCTLNPDRACRMCAMVADGRDLTFQPKTVAQLIEVLPARALLMREEEYGEQFVDEAGLLKAAIPVLREASGKCPACMLAALRQAKIPAPCAEGFNFGEEVKAIWVEINEAAAQREYANQY